MAVPRSTIHIHSGLDSREASSVAHNLTCLIATYTNSYRILKLKPELFLFEYDVKQTLHRFLYLRLEVERERDHKVPCAVQREGDFLGPWPLVTIRSTKLTSTRSVFWGCGVKRGLPL